MKEYPKYVKVESVKYPVHTSFKIALKCFEVINDEAISDTERGLAIIYLLFGFIPEKDLDKFLDMATKYLGCGQTQETHRLQNRDMDILYDWKYILASFASDYHIDLSSNDMHFFHFIELINGLTETCVLSRVREIRNYDLSEVKDVKARAKIAKVQEDLKLPDNLSEENQEALDEFESLFR